MSKRDYNSYKVSIILPVYNAEPYLMECINSILLQDHSNYEVLMIDDGSTDNSKNRIEKQCHLDSRFKLFSISNHGPAYARNVGLDNATGNFIMFLDNDDLLARNSLSKFCRKAVQYKTDVLAGNVICFNDKDYYLYRSLNNSRIQGGIDFLCHSIAQNNFTVMVYNYFYKRSFIEQHHLRFDTNVIHEDELWTPHMLILAKRLLSTPIIHYYYRQRSDSLSKTFPIHQWHDELTYISSTLERIAVETNLASGPKQILLKRIEELYKYICNQPIKNESNKYPQ